MQLAPFLDNLQDRLGDSLRAVQWYREGETELIYLRDDLEMEQVIRRGEEALHRLSACSESLEEDLLGGVGEQLATISVRRRAFLLNFPIDDRAGVIVGIDADVGQSLQRFVDDARQMVVDVDVAPEQE